MALLDLFDKEKRAQRAFEKTAARIINRNAQHEDRMAAMDAMAEYARQGKEGALVALLRRFDITADKGHEDEAEKQLVRDLLGEFGPAVAEPVRQFLRTSENVSWPVAMLRRSSDATATVTIILEALGNLLAKDSFKPAKKLRLLEALVDFKDERVVPGVLPGLDDFDESVRFQTVDLLLTIADERAREPILKLLTSEDEYSERIRQRILRGLADLGWPVTGYRPKVETLLGDLWRLDAAGKLRAASKLDDAV